MGISIPELLLIAVGLSADCFAVSLSGSIVRGCKLEYAGMLRTAAAFGLAQAAMPVIGWLLGRTVVDLISSYDHWMAFAMLAGVGGHMIWESVRDDDGREGADITRGILLLTLAIATSIDALAVGLSFAFLGVNIVVAGAVIGMTSFAITCGGFVAGCRAGKLLGKRAKLAGGIILIGIGLRILISHLIGPA